MATALAGALVAISCSSCHGRLSTTDRESGTFVRPGAPDPRACRTDGDCVPGPLVNPDNGCCDTGIALSLFSRDYVAWRVDWMRGSCQGVECPVLQSPSLPLPCALEGRCMRGRCESSCPLMSPAATPPSVRPASRPALGRGRMNVAGAEVDVTVLPAELAPARGHGASAEGWSPEVADLEHGGRILAACLGTEQPRPSYQAEAVPLIVAALAEYRGQLVPFRDEQGLRCFWANLFRDPGGDRHPDWRNGLVSVRGGGRDYFSVVIHLDGESCSDLRINSPR